MNRNFRAFGNFFKHQAKKEHGKATKKDYQLKAIQCQMMAEICKNLQTII